MISCVDVVKQDWERKTAGEQHAPDGSSTYSPSIFHPLKQKQCYLADLQYKQNPKGLYLLKGEENALNSFIGT